MMNIENSQIQQIHLLLRQANLEHQKRTLVYSFSNGKGESTKVLSFSEAEEMIKYLRTQAGGFDGANKMRKKILSLCHRLQWENKDGSVNMAVLDKWCVEHSYLKKPLMEYTYEELVKLVSQFQAMYRKMLKSSI